jgi:hypothetical protein
MSGEGSSSKWIVGCLLAALLGVLGCAGGAVMLGLWSYRAASVAVQQASTEVAEQMQESQFAQAWKAPAPGSGPETLFPEQLNAWRRTGHDDAAQIPELAIDRPGLHAVYESGITGVDVYAYELPAIEQQALFDAVGGAIDHGEFGSRSKVSVFDGTAHRMTYSFSPPDRQGILWWCQGWLFVFIADDPAFDLDGFRTQYLTQIRGLAPPAASAMPGDTGETVLPLNSTDDALQESPQDPAT